MNRRAFLTSLVALPAACVVRPALIGPLWVGVDLAAGADTTVFAMVRRVPIVYGVLEPELMPTAPYYRAHSMADVYACLAGWKLPGVELVEVAQQDQDEDGL